MVRYCRTAGRAEPGRAGPGRAENFRPVHISTSELCVVILHASVSAGGGARRRRAATCKTEQRTAWQCRCPRRIACHACEVVMRGLESLDITKYASTYRRIYFPGYFAWTPQNFARLRNLLPALTSHLPLRIGWSDVTAISMLWDNTSYSVVKICRVIRIQSNQLL